MKHFITIMLFACLAKVGVAESTYVSRTLPDLLKYSSARCAYRVNVIRVEAPAKYAYTVTTYATELENWGNPVGIDKNRKFYNVVLTENIIKDELAQGEGDDFYHGTISATALQAKKEYLFLCRGGGIFEAMESTPENIYKIGIIMQSGWETRYKTTSFRQLLRDLSDPDLYNYSYNELKQRKKLNNRSLIEAVRITGNYHIISYHLARLAFPELSEIALDKSLPTITLSSQFVFLKELIKKTKDENDDILFEVLREIMDSSLFYADLNENKTLLILDYLDLLTSPYGATKNNYNRYLANLSRTLESNAPYVSRFNDAFFRFAATATSVKETLNPFIKALPESEKSIFIARLIPLTEALARLRPGRGTHLEILDLLIKNTAKYPSTQYLPALDKLNPYAFSADLKNPEDLIALQTIGQKANQNEKTFALKKVANFIVTSLNSIIEKYPNSKDEASKIGYKIISKDNPISLLVDPKVREDFLLVVTFTD